MKEELVLLSKVDLQILVIDALNTVLDMRQDSKQKPPTAAPEPTPGQLLTKKEAAKLLACSPSTIDNAARAGKLPRHYIGKSVRFQKEDVQNLPMQKTPRPMGQPLLERKKRKG